MKKEELKNLLLETALRCNLCFPESSEQLKWFDDGADMTKSDFIVRLYKAIGAGNPEGSKKMIQNKAGRKG